MTEITGQVVEGSSEWHRPLLPELKVVLIGIRDSSEGFTKNVEIKLECEGQRVEGSGDSWEGR